MRVKPGSIGRGVREAGSALSLGIALSVLGCSIQEGLPGSGGRIAPQPTEPPPAETKVTRIVPTDERPAVMAGMPPAPISGGTLAVTRDGLFAIAADSQRDRISVASLESRSIVADIALTPGDEPGRVVEDDSGGIHVVLRRGGAIVSIDRATWTITERRAVCSAPRGIAADGEMLHVACAEGKLVTLPLVGAQPLRTITGLPNDLRDVIVQGDGLVVSRFRDAELLRIDAAGKLTSRQSLPALTVMQPPTDLLVGSGGRAGTGTDAVTFTATAAYRLVATDAGDAVIVHQDAQVDPINVNPEEDSMANPYGGSGCGGIVRSDVTMVAADGSVIRMPDSALGPLPTDIAVSSAGYMAVANAGTPDLAAPVQQVFVEVVAEGGASTTGGGAIASGGFENGVSVMTPGPGVANGEPIDDCTFVGATSTGLPRSVAVAFSPSEPTLLVAQTYDEPALVLFDATTLSEVARISLGGAPIADTGHDLFHRAAGAGLACASCHPEGTDDGHVWSFDGIGARRTQPLDVGLEGTAPFHWDGALSDVGALMSEVFVDRMGGVFQSPERLNALQRWIFALEAPPAPELDAAAVERGRKVFESSTTLCSSCHSGPKTTNNASYDVGVLPRAPTQVPSLTGVAYRTRLMHTGCATSLEERFDPACGGGDLHGRTSQLTASEISDLVTYLKSL